MYNSLVNLAAFVKRVSKADSDYVSFEEITEEAKILIEMQRERLDHLDEIISGYEAIGGRPKGSEGIYTEREVLEAVLNGE
jgi:hypothetical protein